MRSTIITLSFLLVTSLAYAETKRIDLSQIPAKKVYDAADLRPIALTNAGVPSVVVLEVDKGVVVPPHATKTGLRLLTVLSGDMSWGDGDAVRQDREKIYPAGSHLLVRAGDMHWVAARSGDVRLQLVLLHDQKLTPPVARQAAQ